MADSDPKVAPNAEPTPAEEANVFSYDVSTQASVPAPSKPNPASPLAAG
jgi:hypothetical protein